MPQNFPANGPLPSPADVVAVGEESGYRTTAKTLGWRRSVGGRPPFVRVGQRAFYPERLYSEFCEVKIFGALHTVVAAGFSGRGEITLTTRIEDSGLSVRPRLSLLRNGYRTLDDVAEALPAELRRCDGLGKKSLAEVYALLDSLAKPLVLRPYRPRSEENHLAA